MAFGMAASQSTVKLLPHTLHELLHSENSCEYVNENIHKKMAITTKSQNKFSLHFNVQINPVKLKK